MSASGGEEFELPWCAGGTVFRACGVRVSEKKKEEAVVGEEGAPPSPYLSLWLVCKTHENTCPEHAKIIVPGA